MSSHFPIEVASIPLVEHVLPASTPEAPACSVSAEADSGSNAVVAFLRDDADATFARADLFQNYSLTAVSGNTKTGNSLQQLDVSESGTNATFIVQAIDISQDPDNSDTTSANANILVRINNHFYRSGTGL